MRSWAVLKFIASWNIRTTLYHIREYIIDLNISVHCKRCFIIYEEGLGLCVYLLQNSLILRTFDGHVSTMKILKHVVSLRDYGKL